MRTKHWTEELVYTALTCVEITSCPSTNAGVTLRKKLIMKPCGKCGAPIGNQDDYCNLCRTTDSVQERHAIDEPMKKQNTQVTDDEPFMLKIMMFVGGFALRCAFFVPVVSLGCWIVLGNGILLHQSASVGLAIAAIYSAFDLLVDWLNKINPDTIG